MIKVTIVLALILIVTSVLGAIKASTDTTIFFYLSRGSALAVGLFIGVSGFTDYLERLKNTKEYILAVITAIIFSILSLIIINIIDANLVSNRSYGHIIGSGIIVLIITGTFSAASRLTSR